LFGNNSQTTEGTLTGKTLQERFSRDLSDGSNRKAFKISEKIHFFCFVSCFLGKVLDDFQTNFHTNILAFLQGLYLVSTAFKDYNKSLTIVLELGKKCWDKKSKLGQENNFKKAII